jgi:hypothetical protein
MLLAKIVITEDIEGQENMHHRLEFFHRPKQRGCFLTFQGPVIRCAAPILPYKNSSFELYIVHLHVSYCSHYKQLFSLNSGFAVET